MHEMSIAEGIVDIALDTAKENHGQKVKSIQVQIGRLSGVEPDALHFCFDAVTKGTIAEGARLDIEVVPIKGQCLECNHEFSVENYLFRCPQCESTVVHVSSGRELRVLSIDIDE